MSLMSSGLRKRFERGFDASCPDRRGRGDDSAIRSRRSDHLFLTKRRFEVLPIASTKRTPGQAGGFHFCGSSGDSASSFALAARPGLPIRRLSAYTGAAARATSGGIAWRALWVLKSPAFMPIPIKVIATIAAIPTNVVVIRPTVSSSADQRLRGVAAGDHDGAKRRAPHQPMPATAAGTPNTASNTGSSSATP